MMKDDDDDEKARGSRERIVIEVIGCIINKCLNQDERDFTTQ
jgi:hypothetical protein